MCGGSGPGAGVPGPMIAVRLSGVRLTPVGQSPARSNDRRGSASTQVTDAGVATRREVVDSGGNGSRRT